MAKTDHEMIVQLVAEVERLKKDLLSLEKRMTTFQRLKQNFSVRIRALEKRMRTVKSDTASSKNDISRLSAILARR